MYMILGDSVISDKDIIGVFDMDQTTVSSKTRNFLNRSQKNKDLITTSYELPKSFVVCNKDQKNKVYITQYMPQTITKKINAGGVDEL